MRPTRTNRHPRRRNSEDSTAGPERARRGGLPVPAALSPRGQLPRGSRRGAAALRAALLALSFVAAFGAPATGAPSTSERASAQNGDELAAQVRTLLDSAEPKDWTRGLTLLQQAAQVPVAAAAWPREMLIEYLGTRSLESEERTRAILADPVMRTANPGEEVLIHLLGGETSYQRFGAEIVGTLSMIASSRERRDALTKKLEREVSGIIYERLFPILAPYEPNRLVESAISRLEASPEALATSIRRALAAFVGYDLQTAADWKSWWSDHKEETIQGIIIERERRLADERISRMWEQATRHLAGGPPAAYRSWLLDSLSSTQATSIRLSALAEVERFVPQLMAGEPPVSPEQQREILRPLLVRLVEMVSGEATTLRDRDPLRTRRSALNALGKFTLFRDDPIVVDLLTALIDELPKAGFAGDTPASRLGKTAVRVAGMLAAPVGPALDRALVSLLPANGSPEAWGLVSPDSLTLLLDSLELVGARVETVAAIESIYERRSDAREDALEVLVFRGVPEPAVEGALALFVRVLRDPESGDNLRTLALNGIGRLGRKEGIPALQAAIQAADLGRERRSAALLGLRSIGGAAALDAIVELLVQLPETDELRPELVQRGAELCAQDKTLASTERFLIDPTGAPRPWLRAAADRPEVKELLDPARQPKDFLSSQPEAYRRFEEIHAELWRARAAAALTQPELAKVGEALAQVALGVRSVIDVLGSGTAVEPRSPARLSLDALELAAGQRAKLAGQLLRRELDALWTTLGQLLEAEQRLAGTNGNFPGHGGHLAWVIASVRAFRPFEDDAPFISGLERFAARFPLDDEARAELDELESMPPPVENGAAPAPAPPEGTGGAAPPPAPTPPAGGGPGRG